MAKLINIIDSDDFNVREGYQFCNQCPIALFKNTSRECQKNFRFLFGKSCTDIEITLKPTAQKMNIVQIKENIE